MGCLRMGPPFDLIVKLRDQTGIQTFIETGTFSGDTAHAAAHLFPRVITIERSPDFHEAARLRLADHQNVSCVLGHSREVLAKLRTTLAEPCLFWLDAHWSGGATAGCDDECPLLQEIAEIDRSGQNHILMIDDARLFMSPPPLPHRAEKWPTIDAVCRTLTARGEAYICICEDVIVRVPSNLRCTVTEYCRQSNLWVGATADLARGHGFFSWLQKRAS